MNKKEKIKPKNNRDYNKKYNEFLNDILGPEGEDIEDGFSREEEKIEITETGSIKNEVPDTEPYANTGYRRIGKENKSWHYKPLSDGTRERIYKDKDTDK